MNAYAKIATDMAVLVSVVVPTRGRPGLLNRCLRALTQQRMDPSSFEIIVVDDGPSEETRTIVMRWVAQLLGRGPLIGYVPRRGGSAGPAAARNLGWRSACGEIVAFTDDDTVPDRDWLVNGLMVFDERVHAAFGRVVMPLPERPTDYELNATRLEQAGFVTANCFCRRAALASLGGFDERFPHAWREDTDLYFRLLNCRATIVHVPEAVVVHPVRPAPWGVSLSQQKKVLHDALLYKKHPALYREKIRPRTHWQYYLIVAALLAAAAALALGQPAVAAGAGGLWAAMTSAFCWRRLRHTSKALSHVAEMVLTSVLIPPLAVFWRLVGALRYGVRPL